MTKKHKVIIAAIFSLILVLLIIAVIIFLFPGFYVKYALADKYGWKASDIEVIEHHFPNTDIHFDVEYSSVDHYTEKWICKYKGREFNVEHFDSKYWDDYQLEDVFVWCTEYLQENIDSEIVGLDLNREIIYKNNEQTDYFDYVTDYYIPWDNKYVLKKSDSKTLLELQKNLYKLHIYYKVSNLDEFRDVGDKESDHYLPNENYHLFCKNKGEIIDRNSLTKDAFIILVDEANFTRGTIIYGKKNIIRTDFSINSDSNNCVYSFYGR